MANARLVIKVEEGRVAPRCCRRRALAPPLVDDQVGGYLLPETQTTPGDQSTPVYQFLCPHAKQYVKLNETLTPKQNYLILTFQGTGCTDQFLQPHDNVKPHNHNDLTHERRGDWESLEIIFNVVELSQTPPPQDFRKQCAAAPP
ncbi:hypothetical protein E2C01_003761 [Portunus trituberculatus]|uniref:Uncharacterized protein n=1 Tax=Portunus trituberculatus TaxID=210409 RepID=A0A5B7CPL4_PORTR|nr:hypothetical protein [Portunus trituberculatus]